MKISQAVQSYTVYFYETFADGDLQKSVIGNQTGGRVFLFLTTDNFERDFKTLQSNGVTIVRNPSDEKYGRVAVFEDLYGNKWDLIEPKQ